MPPEYTWKGKPLDAPRLTRIFGSDLSGRPDPYTHEGTSLDAPRTSVFGVGRNFNPTMPGTPVRICATCQTAIDPSSLTYQVPVGQRMYVFHTRCLEESATWYADNKLRVKVALARDEQFDRAVWPAVGQVIAEYATRRDLWLALNKRFAARIRNQRKALRQLEQERNDLLGFREHAEALEPELAETKRRLELMTQARDGLAKAYQDTRKQVAESPETRFIFAGQTTPRIFGSPQPLDATTRDGFQRQIADLHRQLAAQTSTLNAWKTGHEALGKEVDRLRSDKRATAQEYSSLAARLQAALSDAAGMKGRIDQLTQERDQARENAVAANGHLSMVHRDLAAARDANRVQRERIAVLERTQAPVQVVPDPSAAYWQDRAKNYAMQLDTANRDAATLRQRVEACKRHLRAMGATLSGEDTDNDGE